MRSYTHCFQGIDGTNYSAAALHSRACPACPAVACPKGEVASSLRGDGDEGKVRAACIRLSLPANELAIGTMLRCFDDALFGDLDNYVSSGVSWSAVVAAADDGRALADDRLQ